MGVGYLMTNLWSSVEAYCWMSGFSYEDYVSFYIKTFPKGKPFRESFYLDFGRALNAVLEIDLMEYENTN